MSDGLQYIKIRFATKRLFTGEQLIQHCSERKDVAARIEWSSRRLFGRHVICGTENHSPTCEAVNCPWLRSPPGRILRRRQSEIRQFCVAILGDEDVGRFDVTMQDAGRVRCGQPIRNACEQL